MFFVTDPFLKLLPKGLYVIFFPNMLFVLQNVYTDIYDIL